MSSLQTLPGFRETYPEDCIRLHHIFRVWRQVAISFGFQPYESPVLEPLDLLNQQAPLVSMGGYQHLPMLFRKAVGFGIEALQ